MPSVAIAYKSLPKYRVDFFDRLRSELASHGVDLSLVYGVDGSDQKQQNADLEWAIRSQVKAVSVGGRRLTWQPLEKAIRSSDLVIVEQASSLLLNYVLMGASRVGLGPQVALWGHGVNLQTHAASGLGERLKRRYSRWPHWWFAYTDGTQQRVEQLGYPRERITVVQNAIDTLGLRDRIAAVDPLARAELFRRHGLTEGCVGVYIGSLYQEKRIAFLVEAARHITAICPGFRLLIAGNGPDRPLAEAAAAENDAIVYLGRKDGPQRDLLLSAASVTLMPGLVGLGVLDAFAADAPMITTDVAYHSPEIEYLQDGVNGRILPADTDPESYAAEVVTLLRDDDRLAQLRAGCRRSLESYTVQEMVRRFTVGVMGALS
jgi:glycosyltransferase involved in cell wall biosynthesis